MTSKKFLKTIAKGKLDVIQEFFDLLSEIKIGYCLIGGIAVNAYC